MTVTAAIVFKAEKKPPPKARGKKLPANIVRFCPASRPKQEVGLWLLRSWPVSPAHRSAVDGRCFGRHQVGRLPRQLAQLMAPLLRAKLLRLSGTHVYSAPRLDMLSPVLVEVRMEVHSSAFALFNSAMADDDPNLPLCNAFYGLLHYHLYVSAARSVDRWRRYTRVYGVAWLRLLTAFTAMQVWLLQQPGIRQRRGSVRHSNGHCSPGCPATTRPFAHATRAGRKSRRDRRNHQARRLWRQRWRGQLRRQ